jgi:hypothetical protein
MKIGALAPAPVTEKIEMNNEQITGQTRILVAGGVMYLVGKGWLPEGLAPMLIAIGVIIVMMAWSYIAHSIQSMVNAVQKSPDVSKVIASPAIVLAAESSKVITEPTIADQVDAVADHPGVTQVIASQAIVNATSSDKVVTP